MIPSVSASSNVGGSNTPARQIACVTVGATGATSSHDPPTNSTVNVAVVALTCDHPGGNVPHAQPSANVAVTVTGVATVPSNGPGGTTP